MSKAVVIRQLIQQLIEYAEEQDTGRQSNLSDSLTELFMRGEIYIIWDPEQETIAFGATKHALKTAIKMVEEVEECYGRHFFDLPDSKCVCRGDLQGLREEIAYDEEQMEGSE